MFVNPRAIPSLPASPRCVTRESCSTASSSRKSRRASISMVGVTPLAVRGGLLIAVSSPSRKQFFDLDEAHARLARRELEKGAHHVLERGIDFPVVRREAEVAAETPRFGELRQ